MYIKKIKIIDAERRWASKLIRKETLEKLPTYE
jgi:hypothetical protein